MAINPIPKIAQLLINAIPKEEREKYVTFFVITLLVVY